MSEIRAFRFATADFPRAGYDDLALDALDKMLEAGRDYCVVVEEGQIVGAIELSDLVFAFGRGELSANTSVSAVARDLPWIDREATFDDVVEFMAGQDLYQVCIENRVLDDVMLLRAIWSEELAMAREFREYEEPHWDDHSWR